MAVDDEGAAEERTPGVLAELTERRRKFFNLVACALLEALPEEGMGEGPLVTVVEAGVLAAKGPAFAAGGTAWDDSRAAIDFWVGLGLLRREPGYLIVRGPLWPKLAAAYSRFTKTGPGFVAREG